MAAVDLASTDQLLRFPLGRGSAPHLAAIRVLFTPREVPIVRISRSFTLAARISRAALCGEGVMDEVESIQSGMALSGCVGGFVWVDRDRAPRVGRHCQTTDRQRGVVV